MTSIAELLATLAPLHDYRADFDTTQLGVVCDRLEELNRLDVARILRGDCPACGGELWYMADSHPPRRKKSFRDVVKGKSKLWLSEEPQCYRCHQSDMEAVPAPHAMLARALRLLELTVCKQPAHYRNALDWARDNRWQHAKTCQRCCGLSIYRPVKRVKK